MIDRKVLLVAVLAAAGFCLPASARNVYVGASWMSSGAEFDTAVDNFDIDDSGWKVFLGVDFVKYFGLEASYRDMGSFSETGFGSTVDADIKAYDIAARGILPLGRVFAIFGKAGYANVSIDGTSTEGLEEISINDDSWELYYGLGLELRFGKSFGVRAEWEDFDVEESLNAFSVGAFFRWGE